MSKMLPKNHFDSLQVPSRNENKVATKHEKGGGQQQSYQGRHIAVSYRRKKHQKKKKKEKNRSPSVDLTETTEKKPKGRMKKKKSSRGLSLLGGHHLTKEFSWKNLRNTKGNSWKRDTVKSELGGALEQKDNAGSSSLIRWGNFRRNKST